MDSKRFDTVSRSLAQPTSRRRAFGFLNNCGACGNVCAANQTCVNGACA